MKQKKTIYTKSFLNTSKEVLISCALILQRAYFASLHSHHWPHVMSHPATLSCLESPYSSPHSWFMPSVRFHQPMTPFSPLFTWLNICLSST